MRANSSEHQKPFLTASCAFFQLTLNAPHVTALPLSRRDMLRTTAAGVLRAREGHACMGARAPHPPLRQPWHDDLHVPVIEVILFRSLHRKRLLGGVEGVVKRTVLVAQIFGEEDISDLRLGAVLPVEHVMNAVQAQMTHRRQFASVNVALVLVLTQLPFGGEHGEAVTLAHGGRGAEAQLEVCR